jgi:hypothetical protein
LVDNGSSRGTQRLSRDELIRLAGIEHTALQTWQLTSRSLLNRDADGYYKFAHRSILEFFFVQAFIEGEQRCRSVKWTDMMCDLFLSWGSSTSADDDQALRLLSADLSATGLFPVAERHQPSVRIDVDWVKNVFSPRSSTAARAKLPSSWRSAVGHVIERDAMVRAYDIADGLVWQLNATNSIHDRDERDVYRYSRYSLAGADTGGREWAVVDLYEMRLLCEILAKKQMISSVIDDRELYWLADNEDGIFSALARIRADGSGETLTYPDLEFVHSGRGRGNADASYTIDVYRVATRGLPVDKVRALAILAHHGDATALLVDDKNKSGTSSWAIRREPTLLVRRGHQIER